MEERLYRRISPGKLIAVRMIAAVAFILTINAMGYVVVTRLRGVTIAFADYFTEPGTLPIFFYIFCVDTFLFALRQVSLLVGEGNLSRLIRGSFYAPLEEERIFMFLDLRSSTTLAWRLGHLTCSRLIQDCFDDLGVVAEHGAEIYQYVEDGVILSWPVEDGLTGGNCLAACFRFRSRQYRTLGVSSIRESA